MIDGHLKVLFYRLPPNSQLPLSKPGNAPLSEDLHEPVAPPGCVKTKSCVNQKLMFDGRLQVLFHAKTKTNSQLLFCEPGNPPVS